MFVSLLSSGSKGNATLFESKDQLILIDNGLSGKEFFSRMEQIEKNPADLSAIIITHDHGDHIKGAGILARKLKIPIYLHKENHSKKAQLFEKCEMVFIDSNFVLGNFKITPFEIPHDASANYAYNIEADGKKVSIVTDLGFVTTLVRQKISGSDLLILESNHDLKMLHDGPYPWELKQRVAGRHGHLSNIEAGKLVASLEHQNLHTLVLAHLSEENNDPVLARDEMQKVLSLNNRDYRLLVAKQYQSLELIEV